MSCTRVVNCGTRSSMGLAPLQWFSAGRVPNATRALGEAGPLALQDQSRRQCHIVSHSLFLWSAHDSLGSTDYIHFGPFVLQAHIMCIYIYTYICIHIYIHIYVCIAYLCCKGVRLTWLFCAECLQWKHWMRCSQQNQFMLAVDCGLPYRSYRPCTISYACCLHICLSSTNYGQPPWSCKLIQVEMRQLGNEAIWIDAWTQRYTYIHIYIHFYLILFK